MSILTKALSQFGTLCLWGSPMKYMKPYSVCYSTCYCEASMLGKDLAETWGRLHFSSRTSTKLLPWNHSLMGFDPWEQDTKDIKRLQRRLCHSGSTFSKISFLKRASWSNWGLGLRGPLKCGFKVPGRPRPGVEMYPCGSSGISRNFHFRFSFPMRGKHLLLDHVWNTSIRRELPKCCNIVKTKIANNWVL